MMRLWKRKVMPVCVAGPAGCTCIRRGLRTAVAQKTRKQGVDEPIEEKNQITRTSESDNRMQNDTWNSRPSARSAWGMLC